MAIVIQVSKWEGLIVLCVYTESIQELQVQENRFSRTSWRIHAGNLQFKYSLSSTVLAASDVHSSVLCTSLHYALALLLWAQQLLLSLAVGVVKASH